MIIPAIHRINKAIKKVIHQNLCFECKCQSRWKICEASYVSPVSLVFPVPPYPVFPGLFFLSRPSSNNLKQFLVKKKRKKCRCTILSQKHIRLGPIFKHMFPEPTLVCVSSLSLLYVLKLKKLKLDQKYEFCSKIRVTNSIFIVMTWKAHKC